MPLWKITDNKPVAVPETKPKKEKFLESDLEEWVACKPDILGEPLLIIGRQVLIPDVKDRLDLLALDPAGNAVIIELKRGTLKDPVDIQALRYASYISKWRFEDFQREARSYLGQAHDADFNFNAVYEEFCSDAGVDEAPELNSDQRMIVVGAAVREKLGTVALWLREHNVDIKVVEVRTYKEGDNILIEPGVIVPLPVSKFAETGKVPVGKAPWLEDGRSWHLDQRCSPRTRELLLKLDALLQDNFEELDGPRWNQKHYVAYRVNNYNWLAVVTSSKTLRLDFLIKKGSLSADTVAQMLGVEKFDTEESFSEKLTLPSSVLVRNRNEQTDRLYLRVKEDFDLANEAFVQFLDAAYKAFPK